MDNFVELNLFDKTVKSHIIRSIQELKKRNVGLFDDLKIQSPIQFQRVYQDCFEIRLKVVFVQSYYAPTPEEINSIPAMLHLFIDEAGFFHKTLIASINGESQDVIDSINNSINYVV